VRLAPDVVVPRRALTFSAVRSAGPGGQNVNRRATKVEMRIALEDLPLAEPALKRLRRLAGRRLVGGVRGEPTSGEIVIVSDEHRTQKRNREECVERLGDLVRRARVPPKPRKKTKPSKASQRRRVEEKRKRAETKRLRKPPEG